MNLASSSAFSGRIALLNNSLGFKIMLPSLGILKCRPRTTPLGAGQSVAGLTPHEWSS